MAQSDEKFLNEKFVNIVVQINGKKNHKKVEKDLEDNEVINTIKNEKISDF